MSAGENLRTILKDLPENVKLIVISKTHTPELIREVYDAGHRIFGENKAQEMASKFEVLPRDIQWHFVGHLQTNKIKYIAPFVALIHSVDSRKLLEEINLQAKKNNRIIDCLLQFHIAEEETKFGLDLEEAGQIITDPHFRDFMNIRLCGVMGMATFTDDGNQVRKEFRNLRSIFQSMKRNYFPDQKYFCEISMGMSGDYLIAVEEGSTIVRIGTAIFGAR